MPASGDRRAAELLVAAFRDLHGPRLHAFALLLTLGDRRAAGLAAGGALSAGAAQAGQLRHPERAAAWLRAAVLRDVRRAGAMRPQSVDARRAALAALGVADGLTDALAQLPLEQRAGLIAGMVERLDIRDVATVLDRSVSATRRVLREARISYLSIASGWLRATPDAALPAGELSRRVDEAAAWAVGSPQAASAQ
ncbi:MAG TPA: hypothetical protein VF153_07305 [Candidatus Limnocylindria bacterium]